MKQHGKILNVFDQTDLDLITKIISKLPDSPTIKDDNLYAYTNGFTHVDPIYHLINKIICSKIETALGRKIKILLGMYLKEVKPWRIHSDYVKGDIDPDLAMLIPLEIFPSFDNKTHTVIFNEECTYENNFTEFLSKHQKIDNNAVGIAEQHCSHVNPAVLEYLSFAQAHEWEPGALIYWDRKLLHCSDNFLKNSVTEKRALVLFTTNE